MKEIPIASPAKSASEPTADFTPHPPAFQETVAGLESGLDLAVGSFNFFVNNLGTQDLTEPKTHTTATPDTHRLWSLPRWMHRWHQHPYHSHLQLQCRPKSLTSGWTVSVMKKSNPPSQRTKPDLKNYSKTLSSTGSPLTTSPIPRSRSRITTTCKLETTTASAAKFTTTPATSR